MNRRCVRKRLALLHITDANMQKSSYFNDNNWQKGNAYDEQYYDESANGKPISADKLSLDYLGSQRLVDRIESQISKPSKLKRRHFYPRHWEREMPLFL